jgi:monofunctional biosynthetic peptidoglycan transglycosylase
MNGHTAVPDIHTLRRLNPAETSYMRYRAAAAGSAAAGSAAPMADAREHWVPLESISPFLIGAVLQAEDPRFFRHHGVDVAALGRKLAATMRGHIGLVGASTVTQQLARNLYLSPRRSFARKLRELGLTLRLEALLSKRRILELYLNTIEWGPDLWGCHAASARYFGKRPEALDAFESTFLASLIAAPRAPLSGRNATRSAYVQLRVAYQLLLAGLIAPDECSHVTRRVRHMHQELAAGAALAEAMANAHVAIDRQEVASLTELCRALRLTPIAATTALAANYGCAQAQRASRELRRRVGQQALIDAVIKGSYESLTPLLAR